MRLLLNILLLLLSINTYSQCLSNQSSTVNPAGPYQPGDVVTFTYTLDEFNGININWIMAFQINLGVGWTNLTPITNPNNPGGSTGSWVWDLNNTYSNGFNFGPGWRFNNTGNSNWGTSSDGPFTFSFEATVINTCVPEDLSVTIEVFDDCTTGGWNNGSCCNDPEYDILGGINIWIVPPTTSNINHY
jgi:hypothetical protein